MSRAALALVALVGLLVPGPLAWAQKPRAERPTYTIGEKWVRNDGSYELIRIEKDLYIFSAGPGQEIHLTKDLAIAKVVKGREVLIEFDSPPKFGWPLEVGKWGVGTGAVRPQGSLASVVVRFAWKVVAYEDVQVAGGTFKTFQISIDVEGLRSSFPLGSFRLWYAPGPQRLVRADGISLGVVSDAGSRMSLERVAFDLAAVDPSTTAPTVASPPVPVAPPPPATAPPASPTAPAQRVEKPALGGGAAQKPRAERPTYAIGEKWIRNDGTYELVRIDKDLYVFSAGPGQETHLTKDLAIAKVVRGGRVELELDPAPKLGWPLEIGKWGRSAGTLRPGGSSSAPVDFTWQVVAYEDVRLSGGAVKTFQISIDVHSRDWVMALGNFRLWYAPDLRQLVRAEGYGSGASTYTGSRVSLDVLRFEVAGVDRPPTVPVIAAPPTPAPPQAVRLSLSGPPGAAVRIDGTQAHRLDPVSGNLAVDLPPGRHVVEVLAPGFETWTETLTVVAGQSPVERKVVLTAIRRVPPAIVLIEPKPGTVVRGDQVKLRVEVRSPYRLRAVEIFRGPGAPEQTITRDPKAPAGEPWVAEPVVRLAEGDNALRVVALDEHGGRVEQAVTLTRQSLIALELRGPPGAEVKVNQDRYMLGPEGTLGLQLPPGSYQVEGTKPGFRVSREAVTLQPGQGRAEHRLGMAPVPPPVAALPPADAEAPRIAINYPPAEARIEREQIVITGLVTDNTEVARVQVAVNGVAIPAGRDIGVTGKGYMVRMPVTLQPGENVIEITAEDKAGNVAQVVRTVTRILPGPPAPKVTNRWAVVIGVGEYERPTIPKLRFAVRDAEAMYEFLTTRGGYPRENVLLLTDNTALKPTLLNIKRTLGDTLARRAGRDDMVLIYFAGHGAPEIDVGGTESDGLSKYLVPRDGDPDSLYTTAFPMDEIQRIFSRIQAERVVLLLDTCYSGTAGGRTLARGNVRASGLNEQFLERLTRSRGRVIMTASGPNEVALELLELGHGVFTYYLLEGLRGRGDRNGDGVVTVSELYEYVEEQVERKAREAGGRQRPMMKGEIEGTLPLARSAGR
ncbi:MAG: caspase family protein [Candidatus Rokubacteria bacterium]|nr:caspase family protein [Candidatus Rokubacteria bacterium]